MCKFFFDWDDPGFWGGGGGRGPRFLSNRPDEHRDCGLAYGLPAAYYPMPNYCPYRATPT